MFEECLLAIKPGVPMRKIYEMASAKVMPPSCGVMLL